MARTISATDAARSFSDLLNRVGFQGERYTIVRGGKAVACLTPTTSPATMRLGDLPALLKRLPSLGKEASAFARDASRAGRRAPGLPRKAPWA